MKNKKSIVVLLFVAVVSLVGLTVAYFSSSTILNNQFQATEYGTDVTETFTSPTGWQPGDETPKELSVENTGNVYEAVRVKVEEQWVSDNGTTLPLKQGNNVAAQINYINSSDWTRVDVDGENYYYYYYNYKLAPGETTSKLLDKVTFNPLIDASTTCTESVENGVITKSCKSNGTGYDKATYTITFTIETVQYNKYQEAWNTGNEITILPEKPKPASEYLIESATNAANAEYNATTKGKMFTFTHGEGANAVNETRYIGDDPNNYVYFNCDEQQEGVEYNYANSCEVWRILGVFDVERTDPNDANNTITETRMKLVRGTDLATTRMWDNRVCETCNGNAYGKNDWNGSLMQTFLTGDYYNRTGEATSNGLKLSARGMIDDAIFYLGGFPYSDSDTTYNAEKIYEMERGTERYNDTRPTSWEGKVALMYPSDMYMTYAKTDGVGCYNQPMNSSVCGSANVAKSWICNTNKLEGSSSYQWTWFLSPYSSDSSIVFYAYGYGLNSRNSFNTGGVRPVVYLKSNIKITDGTGEVGSPYTLEEIQ